MQLEISVNWTAVLFGFSIEDRVTWGSGLYSGVYVFIGPFRFGFLREKGGGGA